jgi:hypothetical protein
MKSETNTPTRSTLASTKADLRELKGNSRATVQELQMFLRELKGKSPQEMLGVVASSQLIRALSLSCALVAAGILLFTAIPYFFGPEEPLTPVAAAPTPAPVTPEPAPTPPVEPSPVPDPIENLGVGEELPAPPNVNPLENNGDDFLKDLE